MRLGLPDGSTQPPDSPAYRAYEVQADKFGEGSNGPLLVVADLPAPIAEDEVTAEQAAIGAQLGDVWDVEAVVPIAASKDRTALAFQVVPEGSPTDESTAELVQNLRSSTLTTAGGADDVAWAGSGDDDVHGGYGPDELHGGTGNDTVRGGPGDDRLWAGGGSDVVHGGQGDDVLHALAADNDPDVLDCGPGRDTAKVRGSERSTTRFRGCETIVVVVMPSAEDEAAEADRDADAE